jgi:hypothetical protein
LTFILRNSRNSDEHQGTVLRAAGTTALLTVTDRSAKGWQMAKQQIAPSVLTITGVSYPYTGDPETVLDQGVLISGWTYPNGFYLAMQWDDNGNPESHYPGPDYDYNDNQSAFWLPVVPNVDYTSVELVNAKNTILLR